MTRSLRTAPLVAAPLTTITAPRPKSCQSPRTQQRDQAMTRPADSFPDDVVAYRRTPEFDATTTPAGSNRA